MPEPHPVTAEELLALEGGRRELIDGRVVEMTPAGHRHGAIAIHVGAALHAFPRRTGAGEVYAAKTGFRLRRDPDLVRAPDAAFVPAGRLEGLEEEGYLPFAPDIAVEVVSPGDTCMERGSGPPPPQRLRRPLPRNPTAARRNRNPAAQGAPRAPAGAGLRTAPPGRGPPATAVRSRG